MVCGDRNLGAMFDLSRFRAFSPEPAPRPVPDQRAGTGRIPDSDGLAFLDRGARADELVGWEERPRSDGLDELSIGPLESTSVEPGSARSEAFGDDSRSDVLRDDTPAEGPRSRLRALKERAHEQSGSSESPSEVPPPPGVPSRGFVRRAAARWLPASWLESRVDLGRFGLVGISLAGLVLLIVVLFAVWSEQPEAEPAPSLPLRVSPPPVSGPAPEKPAARPEPVVVSVVGRVHRPGLVTVQPGARVADALEAAGGAVPDTDVTALNLARKVTDGEQLYVAVPVPGDVDQPEGAPGARAGPDRAEEGGGAGESGAETGGSGKINLNAASAEQLNALPGVGKVTAERIVQWRQEHGRFATVDQLTDVGGIGDSRLARLRDRVRV